MARQLAKKPEKQLGLPAAPPATTTRLLPMELRVCDRLADETSEYEIIGRPYTTNTGKDVHVRVKDG